MPENCQVGPPTLAERQRALELAWSHLSRSQRTAEIERILDQSQADSDLLAGLLVARRGGQLVGGIWAQLQPGRTAFLALPHLVDEEPAETAAVLLNGLIEVLGSHHVRLVQALIESDFGPDHDLLRTADFEHYADLLYLVSVPQKFPASAPASQLEFVTYDPRESRRLIELLERTYVGTQDCPRLNGLRDSADVLAGYLSTGTFDPNRWFFLRHAGADVGCLLLAEHSPQRQWELVYMGLVPEARGRGWGTAVVRHAQWISRLGRASRLVLAVDAANQPAIHMYAAAGFTAWDRRSVMLRVLGSPG